jgi:hypothetical protein
MLKTVNIGGKHYVTAAAVQDFLDRAKAGQFAKPPRTPSPRPQMTAPAKVAA